jgi:hypothetical protein
VATAPFVPALCIKGHPDPALRRARTHVLRVVIYTFLSGGGVSALLQQGG